MVMLPLDHRLAGLRALRLHGQTLLYPSEFPLQPRHLLAQLAAFSAQRLDRVFLVLLRSLQRLRVVPRAPDCLRLFDDPRQLPPGELVPMLPGSRFETRPDLRTAKLFGSRIGRFRPGFGFARPRHLPLIQQTVVAPLTRQHRLRLRPGAIATLNQRQFRADILCTNRHARHDTATPIVLSAPHSGFLTGTGQKILEAASQLDYGKTGYDER